MTGIILISIIIDLLLRDGIDGMQMLLEQNQLDRQLSVMSIGGSMKKLSKELDLK